MLTYSSKLAELSDCENQEFIGVRKKVLPASFPKIVIAVSVLENFQFEIRDIPSSFRQN